MIQKELPKNFNMTDLHLLLNDYEDCPYVVVSKRTFIDIRSQVDLRSRFIAPINTPTNIGIYALVLFGLHIVWDNRAPENTLTFSPKPEYLYDPFEEWVNEVRSGKS